MTAHFPHPPGVSRLEVIHPDMPRGQIRHALFDFDGTLSLIREGWQDIMIPMMTEILLETPRHESEAEIRATVSEFVARLTGRQTIYQMIQLCDEIAARGGTPLDPLTYKHQYNDRLSQRIQGRLADLRAGRCAPEAHLVPGAREWLETLQQRGIVCYLASGTDEQYVIEEAALLGLTPYFAGIYGARDDYRSISKKIIIDRICQANHLQGPELATFGDGYVEIENTKAVDGVAVGVASDEQQRRGLDAWKRRRLIAAGADLIIPDFRDYPQLEAYLLPQDAHP